jgi:hypothetical protein
MILRFGACLRVVGLPSDLSDFPPAQFCLETSPATGTTEATPPVPKARRLQGGRLCHIGTVMHGSRARVVVCSRCTPPAQAGCPQPLIRTPGASGPCDGCMWILPLPYLSPSYGRRSFACKLNPRKPPPLQGVCTAAVAFNHFERQCPPPPVAVALPPCPGFPLTGSPPRPHPRMRGVALRPPPPLLSNRGA